MGEHCQICGKEYEYVWWVTDEIWEKVTDIKNRNGLRCIYCFDKEARKRGIYIYYHGCEQ